MGRHRGRLGGVAKTDDHNVIIFCLHGFSSTFFCLMVPAYRRYLGDAE
jgi:hypothetical protein